MGHAHGFTQTAWRAGSTGPRAAREDVGQVTMRAVLDYGKYGITSKAFTDPDDALWWLESQ